MRPLIALACAGALVACATARPLSQQDELAYYVTTLDGLQGRRPLDPASVDFARLRLRTWRQLAQSGLSNSAAADVMVRALLAQRATVRR